MLTTVIRTVILYLAVVLSVRIMGKRQIGELQPGELAVTILLSEIAAIPIQDNEIPLANSLIPLGLLIGFEVITSLIEMKSVRFRNIVAGNPVTIIDDGQLREDKLRELRLSINDVLAALRQNSVFDISEVSYATIETNGSLSVLLKHKNAPITPKDVKLKLDENELPYPVIIDGRIIEDNFENCKVTLAWLNQKLNEKTLEAKDITLMTAKKSGDVYIIEKGGKSKQ